MFPYLIDSYLFFCPRTSEYSFSGNVLSKSGLIRTKEIIDLCQRLTFYKILIKHICILDFAL